MPIRPETIALQHPGIRSLPRVTDKVTFLHLSRAKVIQDDTGVVALMEEDGINRRVRIPTASVAAILMGPGTSASQAALSTIMKHGTVVLWTGVAGTRSHGWSYSLTSSARWAEAQASLWADEDRRRDVAIAMYEQRFGGLPPGGAMTLNRLRGLEGQRMRKLYARHAKKHGVKFRRDYDPAKFDDADPVNKALSAANACLYGVSLSAIVALGCHPGLGFIHAGHISSFVFDIADLYKAATAIPVAFVAATTDDPAAVARRLTRDALVRDRILPRAVADIQRLLASGLRAASPSEQLLRDEEGFVAGGRNYAPEVAANDEITLPDDGGGPAHDDLVFDDSMVDDVGLDDEMEGEWPL